MATALHPAAPARLSLETLDSAFEGPIQRPWTSPFYLLATFVVALAMVLLPAIYVGLIGLVGYGVYYHATQDLWILAGSGGAKGRFFVYVAPIIGGITAMFFMIKPLLARPARREHAVTLVEAGEPLLFQFVERVCRLVGARKPSRIEVDCQANAAAALRDGWRGFFTGELTLLIGTPLAAGLTAQEFAGVLAHEFGHFTQSVAMRLTYLIRQISYWFRRVVYERDAWDVQLEEAAESSGGWLSLLVHLARLLVWLSRRILWVLMMIGDLLSCALMRQMEYNADRYEIRLAGTDAFERTSLKINLLGVSANAAHHTLAAGWQDRKLPDNLPELALITLEDMPAEVRRSIEAGQTEGKTGLLHTHPCDAARIARARREQAPGVFHSSAPASSLFRDFDLLARETTFDYYRQLMGPNIGRDWLVATDRFRQRREQSAANCSAAQRYYKNGLITVRPLKINRQSKLFAAAPEQCIAQLKRARAAVEKAAAVIEKVTDRYFETVRKETRARLGEIVIAAELQVDPEKYGLRELSPGEVHRVLDETRHEREEVMPQLVKVEAALTMRLEAALALLADPSVARRVPEADTLRATLGARLDALDCLGACGPSLSAMRSEQIAAAAFVEMALNTPALRRESSKVLDSLRDRLAELHDAMSSVQYPANEDGQPISVAQHVFGDSPRLRGDLGDLAALSEYVLDRTGGLYLELMGELAQAAERVEESVLATESDTSS